MRETQLPREREERYATPRWSRAPRQTARTMIASAMAIFYVGCGSAPQSSEPLRSTPVTVSQVEEYSGGEGVNYSASIVPYTQLPLSFKSGGYITSILQRSGPDGKPRNLQQGDYVKKDAVVATVRQADYQRSVDQYKGQLEQAQAGQLKAQQDFTRADALYKANALTQTDYDSAKAQLDSSQGAIATAQAAVAQAQQALADCELRAPMDGQILARNVELGMLISAGGSGAPLFEVSDLHRVRIYIQVPQSLSAGLKPGMAATFEMPQYPGVEFDATLSHISQSIDGASHSMQVELQADNSQGQLFGGAYCNVHLTMPSSPDLLQLPSTALVVGDKGSQVAVLDSNSDPTGVTFPIPGNDDAIRAITLYCDLIAGAVLDGISAEMASSGADIGAREDLPAEVLADNEPESATA